MEHYDILIIGGGAAGLTAGIKAIQGGANVILLEKTGMTGGASAMAGAGTKATGSKWSIESGSTETAEDFIAQITANGHYKNHMPTVENFAYTLGAAFDWLVAEDGAAVPYGKKDTPSASFSGTGRGAGVVKNLTAKFEEEGGQLYLSTPATELIIDNGKVVSCVLDPEKNVEEQLMDVFGIAPGHGIAAYVRGSDIELTDYYHASSMAAFEILSKEPTDAPVRTEWTAE